MADYENNAFFWQKVDTLFLSGKLALTKKKGEAHDTFRNLVYPTDYGHLGDTKSTTAEGVSVYAGSGDRSQITALVVAADILTKELDVKMLIGCTEEEVMAVLRFLNQTDFQKTVLIRRSNVIPSWGISDN
ncbi:MAG: Inorganic pyrophosphatase [Lactimicrobium massiliense]|nr:Inorganic pyrophosphatase [Lactimicrobium massiliense]MDD6560626.1 Inorganic pyrophosphatase [Lactimicrobium massiliense]MDD6675654.1 Inorganic pyrophosphatase [Lactimicrobium massiliense]